MAESGLFAQADEPNIEEEAADLAPRFNPDLLGHEKIEEAVLADYRAKRLPHAMILAGPPGIGKATFAYRLARFLFSNGDGQSEAGLFGDEAPATSLYVSAQSPVFRRVASGGHADLLTVEREFDEKKGRFKTGIAVETVRKITPFLRKTASEGGWRVVIVDGAEDLNTDGQNALLKILEEPPPQALLILVTSQPGKFLPTIRSRCRFVQFDALPENILLHLIGKYMPTLDPLDKQSYARIADGSIGNAMALQQEGGLDQFRRVLSMISSLPLIDMIAAHDFAEQLARPGMEQSYETSMKLLNWYLSRLVCSAARGEDLPAIFDGEDQTRRALYAAFPSEKLLTLADEVSQLYHMGQSIGLDRRQTILNIFATFRRMTE